MAISLVAIAMVLPINPTVVIMTQKVDLRPMIKTAAHNHYCGLTAHFIVAHNQDCCPIIIIVG